MLSVTSLCCLGAVRPPFSPPGSPVLLSQAESQQMSILLSAELSPVHPGVSSSLSVLSIGMWGGWYL